MLKNPNPELLPISQEDEFLPPISGWTTFGGIFLVSTVFITFAVSAFTPLPVTVKAPGIVRPTGEIKLVQATIEGTVTKINVQENQTVTQGAALVTLDGSRFNTRQAQIEGNLQQNAQQLKQISEQLNNLNLQINAETERMKRSINSAKADYLRLEKEYKERGLNVQAQINEARANLQITQEELHKAESDLKASEAALRASESALKIAQEKRDRYQGIADSGAISKNQLEEAQLAVEQQQEGVAERKALLQSQKQTVQRQIQAIESAKARLEAVLANINPSDGLVKMAQEKIEQEKAVGLASIARLNQEKNSLDQRKSELNKQIENDNQELLQVQREIDKTVINAPISGVILKLNLRNINQTVRLGEEIAQIAPNNTALVIKAKVATEDISKVKMGQKTQMRVSAYPYPDYGILDGKVIGISPDAIAPQNTGNNAMASYYEITIKPDKLYLKDDAKNALQPGMEMQTDIIAKNETILQFILRKARILTDV